MKLTRLVLENFGIYRGEQEVDLRIVAGKPVVVIHGENGTGKTTFLNAVSWCLFGARRARGFTGVDLLNWAAAKAGETTVGVKLEFEHDGKTYTMHRGYQAKNARPKRASDFRPLLPTLISDGETIEDPEGFVMRILPPEVVNFFMFDGEMLLDYERLVVLEEDDQAIEQLKGNLELVLGVPVLRGVRDKVKEYAEEVARDLVAHLAVGAADYGRKYTDLKAQIQDFENKMAEHDMEISKVDEEARQISRELAGVEAIQDHLREKTKLQEKRLGLLEDRRHDEDELLAVVPNLHIELLRPILTGVIVEIRARGETAMKSVRRADLLKGQLQLIQDSISSRRCICNRELDTLSLSVLDKMGKRLQEDLGKDPARVREDLPWNYLATALEDMASDDYLSRIRGLEKRIAASEVEIGGVDQRIGEIDIALKGHDQEAVRNRMRRAGELATIRAGLEKAKEGLSEELGRSREELEVIEADLRARDERAKERKLLEGKAKVASEAAQVFDLAVDEFRQIKRKEVEKEATSAFERMKRKPDFKRLKILPTYGLRIVASDGTEIPARSAGEGQIVALSLLAGLNRAARATAPIVMDTPFGRLDSTHRSNVLRYLADMGEQVVLLVTSAELATADLAQIQHLVSSEYRIRETSYEESHISKV